MTGQSLLSLLTVARFLSRLSCEVNEPWPSGALPAMTRALSAMRQTQKKPSVDLLSTEGFGSASQSGVSCWRSSA